MPDGFIQRFCKSCHRSDVRFPSKTAPRCTSCANLHNGARAERLSILRPPPIAGEPEQDPDPEGRLNPAHIKWIKSLSCAVKGHDCRGPVTAHHVRRNTDGGTALKPSDKWTVPLCDGIHGAVEGHHQEGDRIGWLSFEQQYNIDLRALAIRLAEASPHIQKRTENA